ncbi:MAG: fumarylacetoacetate hydrolase family protein [Staphylococcus sp.]|nr:fumarylacetoacetate hydrolase family protein [Staphylococcus sp.]
MKFIRLKSLSPELSLDIHPDSAMILPGRPLFMPEWGEGWVGDVYVAVRIGRLGKNVGRKFASRYYDGISLALHVNLPATDVDSGVLSGMDSTLVYGEWLPAETVAGAMTVDSGADRVECPALDGEIEDAISRVSQYMTLKMGDVIMLPVVGLQLALREQSHLALSVNSAEVLTLKVV